MILMLDSAMRATGFMLGFAFVLQSLEHIRSFQNEQLIFLPRLLLALLLMAGFQPLWVTGGLLLLYIIALHRFQGPYNGGADRMGLLILCCLFLAYLLPPGYWREVVFGYLALQLLLSYFVAGLVKVVNPDWRSGTALCDVFRFSAYPVSESLRVYADAPRLMWLMGWLVMILELLFPLSMFAGRGLLVMLGLTAAFHFANACLFGLNRFFWVWIAAYPSILWLQSRIM
ncbi:MAG: HTTM domain-containing protein [Gammaproteobacteria bacterium]|nr:HTTM domain-containing protein [Gammaproteobacteria bacterium]MDH5653358.1 HTTM domain-containing protein [Gammaproteobacteria bacterium]